MDEQDFDRLFGSQLPNFAGSDWREMEGRLERRDLKRKITRLMWAIPSIATIMFGVSAVLYHYLNQTQQKLAALENRLVEVHAKYSSKPDTVFQKTVVYDTIYQKVFVTKTIVQTPNSTENFTNNQNNAYFEKYDNKTTGEQSLIEREKYMGLNKLNFKSPILYTSSLDKKNMIESFKSVEIEEDSFITENHFSLIPKSVSIGTLAGVQVPFGDFLERGGGSQLGFRTVLGYHNSKGLERWGIVIDAQKTNLFFENHKEEGFGPFDGGSGGMINPGGGKKPLKKVDVPEFCAYQVSLGLRYNLLFNQNFKPYFGVNWSVQIPNQYNINYYYEDPTNNQSTSNKQAAIANLLGGNVGATYQFSKHLLASAEMYYQTQALKNPNPLDAPATLGARLGLFYRFGN
ncbi:hypothetical protein ABID42_003117 [Arcicella rosea]|uniref:hypothetical protein n=1 Tax=Arcicella rosea TaxID=502909 RepID=UPI00345D781F